MSCWVAGAHTARTGAAARQCCPSLHHHTAAFNRLQDSCRLSLMAVNLPQRLWRHGEHLTCRAAWSIDIEAGHLERQRTWLVTFACMAITRQGPQLKYSTHQIDRVLSHPSQETVSRTYPSQGQA